MQGIAKQLKLTQIANILFKTSPAATNTAFMTTSTYKPSPMTFSPKYDFSTHAIHHKNVIKSNYEGKGFYVEQLFTGCLAIYSYYIESGNDCFLVDPLFDIAEYNEIIKSRGKTLKGIFISHYHADYLSGQHELQKQHNCKIYMGPHSIASETVVSLKDKDKIQLGKISLQLWHTPGHTEESSCLVIVDEAGHRDTVFTGDTVFLNQVGRPDLAVKTELTAKDLAGMLYDSIQKIKTLNDDIRIYPGHGSGSSCGKSIGKGDFCTLGTQKQNNYGLKAGSKSQFVENVLAEMPKPPAYFSYNASINKFQPFFYENVQKRVHEELTPERVFQLGKQEDTIVLDVRGTDALREGIIDGSLCIAFDGVFATWVGTLISPKDKLILVGSEEQVNEAINRLFRIGYINIIGHANFSIADWKAKKLPLVVPEFVDEIVQPDTIILDVRKPGEWKADGVVDGALRIQVSELFKHPEKLDKTKTYVTHCKSGYRAKVAWSFLTSQGFKAKAFPFPFDAIFKSGLAKKKTL